MGTSPRHGIGILLLTLGLSGCPGVLEDPQRFRADYCGALTEELFVESCGSAECHHGGAAPAAGLDLVSDGVAERLIDAAPNSTGVCATASVLLDPDAPSESLLYTKLGPNPPCGVRMPPEGTVSDEQLTCLLEWIAAQD